MLLKKNVKEDRLYFDHTKMIQNNILDYARALFVWRCDPSRYQIAKQMIAPLLFAGHDKRRLLKIYDESYYDNVKNGSEKEFGKLKQIRIKISGLIFGPEEYMRYFCKLKEKCASDLTYRMYLPIGIMIYLCCLLSLSLKHCFAGKDDG